ncbi:MAG: ribonuclease H-like domain-containing protein, partial [Candidatus Lindowbacteria bacterium]|nr:ribonuclease H-like domain-containing protein [Candidatus Lindowbacteria bacterium]
MNVRDQLERYAIASKPGPARPRESAAPAPCTECEHKITVFPSHQRHGGFELDTLGGSFRNAARTLVSGRSGEALEFSRIAFMDTETTGLSGGAGVCAFLVGIGYDSPTGFVVEQFLMNDFPAERDMLRKVCERLETFDTIASYNGRAFDVPILEARLLLNG